MTGTFSGIRPTDVAGFIGVQISGAVAATLLFQWLVPIAKVNSIAQTVEHDL
jgi:hypothetical protein